MASTGTTVYKTARWVVLIALVIVVIMMLKRPKPAAAPLNAATVAEKSTEFNTKLQSLQSAQEQSGGGEATFTSEEVNSFLTDSTIRAAQQAAAPSAPKADDSAANADAGPPLTDAEIEAAQQKTQIAFEGDEVVAQTMVQRYGRDIYVTVRGKLGARNGYMEFTPTAFKIGEFSVPVSLVNDRLQEKLAEPDTHEKLKLPAFIADLHVENGELKIKQK